MRSSGSWACPPVRGLDDEVCPPGVKKHSGCPSAAARTAERRRHQAERRACGTFSGELYFRNVSGYFWLTSDQDQITRPTMHFCQSPSKSSMRLSTRGGLSAALSE